MSSALRVVSNPSFLLALSGMSLRASSLRALVFTLVYQGLADMISPSNSHGSSLSRGGGVNCGKTTPIEFIWLFKGGVQWAGFEPGIFGLRAKIVAMASLSPKLSKSGDKSGGLV